MQTVLEKEVDGRQEKEKGGADWRRRGREGGGRRETGDKRRVVRLEKESDGRRREKRDRR